MEENDEGRRRRRRVMMSNPIAFAASSGDVSLHPLHCSMALLLCNRKKRKEKRARFWKDIRSRGSWRTTTTVLAFNLIIPRHLFLFLISFWRGRLTLLALHASNIKHTHTHTQQRRITRERKQGKEFFSFVSGDYLSNMYNRSYLYKKTRLVFKYFYSFCLPTYCLEIWSKITTWYDWPFCRF